jgi:hypothetical protein
MIYDANGFLSYHIANILLHTFPMKRERANGNMMLSGQREYVHLRILD